MARYLLHHDKALAQSVMSGALRLNAAYDSSIGAQAKYGSVW